MPILRGPFDLKILMAFHLIIFACRASLYRLGQCIFETIEEAQEQAAGRFWTYNNPSHGFQANHCRAAERPNMGIRGITSTMKLKMVVWILQLNPTKNGEITFRE